MKLRIVAAAAIAALLAHAIPASAESGFWGRAFDRSQTSAVQKPDTRKLTKAERAKAERQKKLDQSKMTRAERRKLEQARKAELAKASRAEQRKQQQAAAQQRKLDMLTARRQAEAAERRELRAERPLPGILAAFFGGTVAAPAAPRYSDDTRAQDAALQARQAGKKQFQMPDEFQPQSVAYNGGYKRGTIVIDTRSRYLYLVEGFGQARRYKVAVGREGLLFTGKATVGDMQEWPRWIPTKDMQKREPKKYGQYKDGMDGGPANPLGARAIYLYQGKKDTYIRIHGTNQPQSVGTNSSNGCFRMVNEHVMDLYTRVGLGTEVVVL